jgi:outer membrane protein OmpA-like peptidoglycan-associated protein
MNLYKKIKKILYLLSLLSLTVVNLFSCKAAITRELASSDPVCLMMKNGALEGYSPSITADETAIFYESDIGEKYNYDIYVSYREANGWSSPRSIKNINASSWDAGPFLSYDQNYLLITSSRDGGEGKEDIWISRRSGNEWRKPVNMGKSINSDGYDGFASLSPDGKTLYFTRMDNSKKEIWGCGFYICCSVKKDGSWTEPQRMPYPINLGDCEFGPRIMADGRTLIFSSDRSGGFGGFDLYKSGLQQDGTWSEPVNLGSRINTGAHETLASISASESIIYFSRRSDKYTSRIFSALIVPLGGDSGVITVSGTVRNAKKPEQTLAAEFRMTDINKDDEIITLNNNEDDGTYMVILNQGRIYDVSVWSDGFTFYSTRFDLKSVKEFKEIKRDILLEPISSGAKIILENIYFELDSHALLPESRYELQRIIDFMTKNSKIKVEIGGHTDSTGSAEYNMDLSLKRAESVMKYLTDHGIDTGRLDAKGYGQTRRIDLSETDEGRQKNRRVEFEILALE